MTAIQGVDDTLKEISRQAVAGLTPTPDVTVGPLDRDSDELRLNWFLYRVSPSPAYRNMEPPQTGWRTSRGRPPLALCLHYMLTAFPATATNGGDQEQFAHAGLAAVMRALHENAVVREGEAMLSLLATPLVEPLRITMDDLDLEAVSKIWTAVSKPIRLSVGYEVSLVVIDSTERHSAGPPVKERRAIVAPSIGPRMRGLEPARVSVGQDLVVAVEGLIPGTAFTLVRETGDPPGAGDWPMTMRPPTAPGTVTMRLPDPAIAPGARRLDAAATVDGLPFGRDSIGLTVVPAVVPGAPLTPGTAETLQTAHAAADVEVFLDGVPVNPADVAFVSATHVQVTFPAGTPAGTAEVQLRANRVAGPPVTVVFA